MDNFSLHIEQGGQGLIVHISGELDFATAPKLRDCLREVLGQHVTLDFSGVTFMDSSAIGVLVAAQKRAAQDGGQFVLHGVQPAQMRVLEVTGLADHWTFNSDGDAPA